MDSVALGIGRFVIVACAMLIALYILSSTIVVSHMILSSDVGRCSYSGDTDYAQQCVELENNDN